jgi:hypothetical protein
MLILTLLWLTHTAVAAEVQQADCSPTGVSVTFADGKTSNVPLNAKRNETCEQLRTSPDKKSYGWLKQVQHNDDGAWSSEISLLVNGREIAQGIYLSPGWRFINGGAQAAYCLGPAHGGCSYELWDVQKRREIKTCEPHRTRGKCKDWEKLFEGPDTQDIQADIRKLSGG